MLLETKNLLFSWAQGRSRKHSPVIITCIIRCLLQSHWCWKEFLQLIWLTAPAQARSAGAGCPGQWLWLSPWMVPAQPFWVAYSNSQIIEAGIIHTYLVSDSLLLEKPRGSWIVKALKLLLLSNPHFFAGLAQVNLPSFLPEKSEGGFKVTLKRGSVTCNRFGFFLWLRQTETFILFHSIVCFTLLSKSYYDFRNAWKIKALKGHNLKCFLSKW